MQHVFSLPALSEFRSDAIWTSRIASPFGTCDPPSKLSVSRPQLYPLMYISQVLSVLPNMTFFAFCIDTGAVPWVVNPNDFVTREQEWTFSGKLMLMYETMSYRVNYMNVNCWLHASCAADKLDATMHSTRMTSTIYKSNRRLRCIYLG